MNQELEEKNKIRVKFHSEKRNCNVMTGESIDTNDYLNDFLIYPNEK